MSASASPPSQPKTIEIKPRRSRVLARFLVGAHGLAVVALVSFVPGRLPMVALLALVALSFLRNWRRHVLLRGARVPRRIVSHEDGRWQLQGQEGVMHSARLLPSSYLHPQLVILNFALDERPRWRSLVLCRDSLDAQTLRQLRVRLRVAAQGQPDAQYHPS